MTCQISILPLNSRFSTLSRLLETSGRTLFSTPADLKSNLGDLPLISLFFILFTRPLETGRRNFISIVADLDSDLADLDYSSDLPVLPSLYEACGDRSETLLSIVADHKCYLGDRDSSSDLPVLHFLYQTSGDGSADYF